MDEFFNELLIAFIDQKSFAFSTLTSANELLSEVKLSNESKWKVKDELLKLELFKESNLNTIFDMCGFDVDSENETISMKSCITKEILAKSVNELSSQIALKLNEYGTTFGTDTITQRLNGARETVSKYKNEALQVKAKKCIPTAMLYQKAFQKVKSEGIQSTPELMRDELMKQLLHWYKNEFFTWTNSPKCHGCQSETKPTGRAQPNAEDRKYGAQVVEIAQCTTCSILTRFPRYNDAGKLLETRTGRCGEWANVFTLLCISLGYETRYCIDFTDHVWTEFWSTHQKRWIHLDSCEDAFDKPLMYDKGWGKKLDYIFGISFNEITDVSHRYIFDYQKAYERRKFAPEFLLSKLINKLNIAIWLQLPEEIKKTVLARRKAEEVEFRSFKPNSDEEFEGRISGDLAWRIHRGEAGSLNTLS